MSGPPNDEAFSSHPLYSRGLKPYGAWEVQQSSWIRRIERMNSSHPRHQPERYWALRHLIFPLKECTFECVCKAFDVRTGHGTLAEAIPEMVKLLEWERG
jgi:hypothetical protein